jgi:nitroimidazol reductase NimA-like FMN-containing flavoprotein (pyridoxamine 5'-phosphate oxidase superfamily)
MSDDHYPSSARSRVRRHPERGSSERAAVDAILDEALVCHVGIVADGRPVVIPMAYARDGGRLILHGATGSRLIRALADGCEACVTVTLLDGIVVARSAFDSSMNYRSAVVLGRARRLTDPAERRRALDVLTDHLIPGRTAEVRPPTANELAATEVIEVAIAEASAKTRSGPPSEPGEDSQWIGVVPLRLAAGRPEPAATVAPGTPSPRSVRRTVAARRRRSGRDHR